MKIQATSQASTKEGLKKLLHIHKSKKRIYIFCFSSRTKRDTKKDETW